MTKAKANKRCAANAAAAEAMLPDAVNEALGALIVYHLKGGLNRTAAKALRVGDIVLIRWMDLPTEYTPAIITDLIKFRGVKGAHIEIVQLRRPSNDPDGRYEGSYSIDHDDIVKVVANLADQFADPKPSESPTTSYGLHPEHLRSIVAVPPSLLAAARAIQFDEGEQSKAFKTTLGRLRGVALRELRKRIRECDRLTAATAKKLVTRSASAAVDGKWVRAAVLREIDRRQPK